MMTLVDMAYLVERSTCRSKSSTFSSIGLPCGVRSAACSPASR